MLLREAVEKWITRREINLAPSTVSGYRRLERKYIAGTEPGNTELEVLEEDHMVDLLRPLLTAGHTRQAQLLQILVGAVLKDAMIHRLIRWNPMACVDHVKHKGTFTAWLTVDQARTLLKTSRDAHDPWYIAWVLMLCCGLRRGEMLGLQWTDIDEANKVLHVVRQRVRIDNKVIESKPKTLSGIRDINLDEIVLRELRLQQRKGKYILEGKTQEGLADALDRAIERAHVPRVTPHGLRHSMASAAAAEGVDIKTTQLIMGHAHYTTTADIYTHVDQTKGREAAKNIAVALIPARLEIV